MSGQLRWTITGITPDLAIPDDPNSRHDLLNEQRLWLERDPVAFLVAALDADDVEVRIDLVDRAARQATKAGQP